MSHSSVLLFGQQMFTLSLTLSFSCLSNNFPIWTCPQTPRHSPSPIHTSRLIPPLLYKNVHVCVYGIHWN
jgi:hypothetical protein